MTNETDVLDPSAQAESPGPENSSPPRKRSPSRQRAYFLRQFQRCGKVSEAAARTGVTPRTIQRWRANDLRFAQRFDQAVAWRQAELEDHAFIRARRIEFKPYVYRGRHVASVARHNDRLLIHMLDRMDRAQSRHMDQEQMNELARQVAEKLVEMFRSGT